MTRLVPQSAPNDHPFLRPGATLEFARAVAEQRLSRLVWDYLQSGAGDEYTVEKNEQDFQDFVLNPHVLRNVEAVTTQATLFGRRVSSPICVAPVGAHGLFHSTAELGTARGARSNGVPMVVSAYSNTSIEDISRESDNLWAQINVPPDSRFLSEFVDRASRVAKAIVVTVDTPVVGARDRQAWDGLSLPDDLDYPMLSGIKLASEHHGSIYRSGLDASFDVSSLSRLCAMSSIPVIVKGVLRGDDAVAAVNAGAAGIIVSNHGGRNLDSGLSTVHALPSVVAAVDCRVPVLLDGGIRRGSDILKCLALGATGVLVGRPVIWGLTAGGDAGVAEIIKRLTRELAMAMALCGVRSVEEVDRDILC